MPVPAGGAAGTASCRTASGEHEPLRPLPERRALSPSVLRDAKGVCFQGLGTVADFLQSSLYFTGVSYRQGWDVLPRACVLTAETQGCCLV